MDLEKIWELEFHKYLAQRSVCTVQTSLGGLLVGIHEVSGVSGIVSGLVFLAHNLQM